mmetsp:Transcript_21305/g.46245  ORF Transcript_21305/g.46245 Transcript_21305/m.46245 type:complete len:502 (-) Transcript_21305:878-2383(-)
MMSLLQLLVLLLVLVPFLLWLHSDAQPQVASHLVPPHPMQHHLDLLRQLDVDEEEEEEKQAVPPLPLPQRHLPPAGPSPSPPPPSPPPSHPPLQFLLFSLLLQVAWLCCQQNRGCLHHHHHRHHHQQQQHHRVPQGGCQQQQEQQQQQQQSRLLLSQRSWCPANPQAFQLLNHLHQGSKLLSEGVHFQSCFLCVSESSKGRSLEFQMRTHMQVPLQGLHHWVPSVPLPCLHPPSPLPLSSPFPSALYSTSFLLKEKVVRQHQHLLPDPYLIRHQSAGGCVALASLVHFCLMAGRPRAVWVAALRPRGLRLTQLLLLLLLPLRVAASSGRRPESAKLPNQSLGRDPRHHLARKAGLSDEVADGADSPPPLFCSTPGGEVWPSSAGPPAAVPSAGRQPSSGLPGLHLVLFLPLFLLLPLLNASLHHFAMLSLVLELRCLRGMAHSSCWASTTTRFRWNARRRRSFSFFDPATSVWNSVSAASNDFSQETSRDFWPWTMRSRRR